LKKQVEEKELRKLEEKRRKVREDRLEYDRWDTMNNNNSSNNDRSESVMNDAASLQDTHKQHARQQQSPQQQRSPQRGSTEDRRNGATPHIAVAAEVNDANRHSVSSGASTPSLKQLSRIPVLKSSPVRSSSAASDIFPFLTPLKELKVPPKPLSHEKPPTVPMHHHRSDLISPVAEEAEEPIRYIQSVREDTPSPPPSRSNFQQTAPSPTKKLAKILKNANLNQRGLVDDEAESANLYKSIVELKQASKKGAKKAESKKPPNGQTVAFGSKPPQPKPDLTAANRFQTDKSKFVAGNKGSNSSLNNEKKLPKIANGSKSPNGKGQGLGDTQIAVIKADHLNNLRKTLGAGKKDTSTSSHTPQKPTSISEDDTNPSPRPRRLVKPAPSSYETVTAAPSSHHSIPNTEHIPAAGVSTKSRNSIGFSLSNSPAPLPPAGSFSPANSPYPTSTTPVRPPWGTEEDGTDAVEVRSRNRKSDKVRPPWGTEEDVPVVSAAGSQARQRRIQQREDEGFTRAEHRTGEEKNVQAMMPRQLRQRHQEELGYKNAGLNDQDGGSPSTDERIRKQALDELMSFGSVLDEERRKVQRELSFHA
jgi:hypothetical protein